MKVVVLTHWPPIGTLPALQAEQLAGETAAPALAPRRARDGGGAIGRAVVVLGAGGRQDAAAGAAAAGRAGDAEGEGVVGVGARRAHGWDPRPPRRLVALDPLTRGDAGGEVAGCTRELECATPAHEAVHVPLCKVDAGGEEGDVGVRLLEVAPAVVAGLEAVNAGAKDEELLLVFVLAWQIQADRLIAIGVSKEVVRGASVEEEAAGGYSGDVPWIIVGGSGVDNGNGDGKMEEIGALYGPVEVAC